MGLEADGAPGPASNLPVDQPLGRRKGGKWEVTKGHGERLKELGVDDETGGMALRPFARHPKRKADDETTPPNAADEFAQFFSNDPRPDDAPSEPPAAPVTEPPAPAVAMEEQSAAGWYPDTKDPGLMRYWDGFHLTGQTMRVGPPPPVEPVDKPSVDTPEPNVATAVVAQSPSPSPARYATDLLAPDVPPTPLLGSRLLPGAGGDEVTAPEPPPAAPSDRSAPTAPATSSGPEPGIVVAPAPAPGFPTAPAAPATPAAPAAPVAPVSPAVPLAAAAPVAPAVPAASTVTPPVASAADDGVDDREDGKEVAATSETGSTGATRPSSEAATDRTNSWAERTEQAVTRAQATGTPEAWQEAAKAAAVVSEMAQTMQAAADLRQSAEQLGKVAEEARRRADEAEEAAAEARRTVDETAQAAKQAAEASEAAARKAEEARRKAERATEATPRVADRAKDAAQAAAGAKRRAQMVEEIVARAHNADTPEAWSEARRSAERAAESDSEQG